MNTYLVTDPDGHQFLLRASSHIAARRNQIDHRGRSVTRVTSIITITYDQANELTHQLGLKTYGAD